MYVIKSNRKTNSYTVRKINRVTQVVRVGRRGLQGETGPQGPKGDQGDPATNLVQSVNGKQGVVALNATDVGADPTGSASQALVDAKAYTDTESAQTLQDAKDYTDTEVSTLDSSLATVAKTGSYNDLSNKPTIPSIAGLATEQYVDNGLATKVDKEVGKGLSANDYTTLEKNKLAGIANNATANQTDSYLLNRTNHTGTQAQSTITNLTTDLAAKANASDTVNLTGNQTVAGVKTFSSSPVVPTATTNTQAVNKGQMDTANGLKVNKAGDTMTGVLTNTVVGLANRNVRGSSEWQYGVGAGGGMVHYNPLSGQTYEMLPDGSGLVLAGVRILKGTGFPNGVVSAPVGSTYIDTNATNGAIEWKKATGSSTTGWVVSVGDTGWRDISYWGTDGVVNGVPLKSGVAPTSGVAGAVSIKRENGLVRWRIRGVTFSAPLIGFDIPGGYGIGTAYSRHSVVVGSANAYAEVGSFSVFVGVSGQSISGTYGLDISYSTPSTWPVTLP